MFLIVQGIVSRFPDQESSEDFDLDYSAAIYEVTEDSI